MQAELNEVLEDDEEETPAPTPPAVTPPAPKVTITSPPAPPPAPSGATGLESLLLERLEMYKTAISNAKDAGETSKVRRYDRGLKVSRNWKLEHTLPVKLIYTCISDVLEYIRSYPPTHLDNCDVFDLI